MTYTQAELNEALDSFRAPFIALMEKIDTVLVASQEKMSTTETEILLTEVWDARDVLDEAIDAAIGRLGGEIPRDVLSEEHVDFDED